MNSVFNEQPSRKITQVMTLNIFWIADVIENVTNDLVVFFFVNEKETS